MSPLARTQRARSHKTEMPALRQHMRYTMPAVYHTMIESFAEAGVGTPEEMERIRGEGGSASLCGRWSGWIARPRSEPLTPSSKGGS
jgi:hypothetical protein